MIVVTITKTLEPFWGAEECQSDEELIEILQEDTSALLDCATWTIERKEGEHA